MQQAERGDVDTSWRARQHLRLAYLDESSIPPGAWARIQAFIGVLAGGIIATLLVGTSALTAVIALAAVAGSILVAITG